MCCQNMHDRFGFIADTCKILISPDFPYGELTEKGNSDSIIALFSKELTAFSNINPYSIPMKLTSRDYFYFRAVMKVFHG